MRYTRNTGYTWNMRNTRYTKYTRYMWNMK